MGSVLVRDRFFYSIEGSCEDQIITKAIYKLEGKNIV